MRILRIPEAATPALTQETARLEPLLEKIQVIEDRLRALEQPRKAEKPAAPITKMSVADDTLHKPLLTKMWKYLHDDRPPKAI